MALIKMTAGTDYPFVDGMANTLSPEQVCSLKDPDVTGEYTKLHPDGWTITGRIVEDWFYWVNDFEAHHPLFGEVRGNFEEEVFATSHECLKNFLMNHAPDVWDYMDI